MRTHVRPRTLAAFLPLVVLAAACSGGDDDGGGGGETGGGGGEGVQTIAGGLALLPESGEDQETVAWGDLARAAEVAGLDRPSDAEDTSAVDDYVMTLTVRSEADEPSPAAVTPEAAHAERRYETAFADEVGWSIVDVDRFVERQTPPGVVTVLEGSFDEDRLAEALGEAEDGTWQVGDGEPFERDLRELTPARPLGETLWLAHAGDLLTVAHSPDHTAAVRQALAGGDTRTLADDPALAGLAAALDAESPYAAMLVRPGLSLAPPLGRRATPEQLQELCGQGLTEATTAAGTAIADDDGPVILVALAHPSPAAAEANAEAFERVVEEGVSAAGNERWSELVSLDGVEVAGDGLVVVARLRPADPSRAFLWRQVLLERDTLVAAGC